MSLSFLWAFLINGVAIENMAPMSDAELRGLSVVNEEIVWVSGAKSTVIKTHNGLDWRKINAPTGVHDFRDVQAFNEHSAYLMSAGQGPASKVWKTEDGGEHWQLLIENTEPQGFWNAIDFWDKQRGLIFGDPVNGRFQVRLTRDGGQTWHLVNEASMPLALPNEAAFAASGTCAVVAENGRVAFVTGGGQKARAFVSMDYGENFRVAELPLLVNSASQGAFSVAWIDKQTLIAVGGDYTQKGDTKINATISHDNGVSWQPWNAGVSGFLSSVDAIDGALVVTGLSGSALGRTQNDMQQVSVLPFNAAKWANNSLFFVGPNGNVAKAIWHD